MSCCKPRQFTVTSVDLTGTDSIILTVTPKIDTIGDDSRFRLCIMKAQIPPADTRRIIIIDSTGAILFDCFMCNGNYLRADSLRKFICHNGDGCCCTFNFNCFRGDDPVHIQFFHRFCPSAFEDADTGADPGPPG